MNSLKIKKSNLYFLPVYQPRKKAFDTRNSMKLDYQNQSLYNLLLEINDDMIWPNEGQILMLIHKIGIQQVTRNTCYSTGDSNSLLYLIYYLHQDYLHG